MNNNTERIEIKDFSEKAVIITGNTYPHRERIKSALPKSRAIWHRKEKGWIFPKRHIEALRESLADLLERMEDNQDDDMPGKWGIVLEEEEKRERLEKSGWTPVGGKMQSRQWNDLLKVAQESEIQNAH